MCDIYHYHHIEGEIFWDGVCVCVCLSFQISQRSYSSKHFPQS